MFHIKQVTKLEFGNNYTNTNEKFNGVENVYQIT